MSWTVVEKVRRVAGGDVFWQVAEIFTGGLLENESIFVYTLEDDHGNRKDVIAHENYEIGDKIAEGEFHDLGE